MAHTDQGCTWTFAVRARSLELAPPSQYCFNQVIGSGYTMTSWSVTVSGRHEDENIAAISHLPTGDYNFVLAQGRRTKAGDNDRDDTARRFAGAWKYDATDPQAGVNILDSEILGSGSGQPQQSPQTGLVTFAKSGRDMLTARTADGCRWTLVVRGNTGELDPARQTCQLPDSSVTLTFWSVASDGEHQASVMDGVSASAGTESAFYLGIGALTRQARQPGN